MSLSFDIIFLLQEPQYHKLVQWPKYKNKFIHNDMHTRVLLRLIMYEYG